MNVVHLVDRLDRCLTGVVRQRSARVRVEPGVKPRALFPRLDDGRRGRNAAIASPAGAGIASSPSTGRGQFAGHLVRAMATVRFTRKVESRRRNTTREQHIDQSRLVRWDWFFAHPERTDLGCDRHARQQAEALMWARFNGKLPISSNRRTPTATPSS
jgi:hypothetical protein